jgi:hypothetical protein
VEDGGSKPNVHVKDYTVYQTKSPQFLYHPENLKSYPKVMIMNIMKVMILAVVITKLINGRITGI